MKERLEELMAGRGITLFRVAKEAGVPYTTLYESLKRGGQLRAATVQKLADYFGASILHAWGVPDVYIMQRGGWESDHVMKRVYREALNDEQAKMSMLISERIAHEMPTKNEE